MTTVYLALGANVGDAHANIAEAIKLLGGKLQDIQSAPIYTSKAVGYTDQPDFLNTAVSGSTDLSPLELLKFIKEIEKKVGRIWRFRWGPREIDIDIIFYGNQTFKNEDLEIPHPRFRDRDFVLKPVCDLDPGVVDPITSKTVRKLLDELPAGSDNILS
jgi:2-amino-4-hydroxy-6-hydroxymethyldihydropteridine diphosphokinase